MYILSSGGINPWDNWCGIYYFIKRFINLIWWKRTIITEYCSKVLYSITSILGKAYLHIVLRPIRHSYIATNWTCEIHWNRSSNNIALNCLKFDHIYDNVAHYKYACNKIIPFKSPIFKILFYVFSLNLDVYMSLGNVTNQVPNITIIKILNYSNKSL